MDYLAMLGRSRSNTAVMIILLDASYVARIAGLEGTVDGRIMLGGGLASILQFTPPRRSGSCPVCRPRPNTVSSYTGIHRCSLLTT